MRKPDRLMPLRLDASCRYAVLYAGRSTDCWNETIHAGPIDNGYSTAAASIAHEGQARIHHRDCLLGSSLMPSPQRLVRG